MCDEGDLEKMDEEIEEIESEELRNERQQRILNVRKEKSRDAARNRRSKENTQYEELAKLLPFPPSVTSQLDKASIIRLTISYLKYHELLGKGGNQGNSNCDPLSSIIGEDLGAFLLQALDGFLFCINQDGKFIYISETVTTHLGLSQLDLIGTSIFSIVHPDDQKSFSEMLNRNVPNSYPLVQYQYNDFDVMVNNEVPFSVPTNEDSISTFTRMKCALIKRSGCYVKSSGYKVIHVSGKMVPYRNFDRNSYFSRVLVATGQPLPPPTICELKIDTKVFVSRITMDFDIVFCEGRIRKYLDFRARDIVGVNAYQFYLNQDMQNIQKYHYECMSNGKTVTIPYRWINKYGGFVMMQTVGTVIKRHGPQGEESQILCVNYISSTVEDSDTVVHKMQEKFKRLQVTDKSENTDDFDDFGVEARHPNFSSLDIVPPQPKNIEPEGDVPFALQHVPPLTDLPRPMQGGDGFEPQTMQGGGFEPLADIGIPYPDRIPSIAQEEADRLLAVAMANPKYEADINSDMRTCHADINSPDVTNTVFPDLSPPLQSPSDYSYSSDNNSMSPPRFRSTNQMVNNNTMNPGPSAQQYMPSPPNTWYGNKNYENNSTMQQQQQQNVYNNNTNNFNANPMCHNNNNKSVNANQIVGGNLVNMNENLDCTIVKHELPSPPHRQMFNNWPTGGGGGPCGGPGGGGRGPGKKRMNSGVYLQHPTWPNTKVDNFMPMGMPGPGDVMFQSENNYSAPNNNPYSAPNIEGMSLLKQLEYNHNGCFNDVPIEQTMYGYGCHPPPPATPLQRDFP